MHVELVQFTPNPMAVVYYGYHHEKHGVTWPENLASIKLTEDQYDEVAQLFLEGWCPVLEFPVTLWSFVVPRSLHAQIRVHRHGSHWSESQQLSEFGDFADKSKYWIPDNLTDSQTGFYQSSMRKSQEDYQALRTLGLLPGVARNVLPLAAELGLTCQFNWRTLRDLAIMRRCHILQGVLWNPLLDEMRRLVVENIDPHLGFLFDLQPCDVDNRCLSALEQLQRVEGKDPHDPCPRFVEIMKSQGARSCCDSGCVGCLKHAREHGKRVERSIER